MMAHLFLKAGMKEYDFVLNHHMHLSILFHHFGTQTAAHLAKYSYEYIQEYLVTNITHTHAYKVFTHSEIPTSVFLYHFHTSLVSSLTHTHFHLCAAEMHS